MKLLKKVSPKHKKQDLIEVSNNWGIGDGTPLLVERNPDLKLIFQNPNPRPPQHLTKKNIDYWNSQDHKIIKEAEGYITITPEYNHSISSAMKNTLDYFLEEYFFKPSGIVSYSVGPFGGILAGNHLRQILAEMGAPAIPSQFPISKVQDVFGTNGELLDKNYERRIKKFFDEFEWYLRAFSEQRKKGTPY